MIDINPDGEIIAIYDDAIRDVLDDLGPGTITRVSHVEPDEAGRWWADMAPVDGPMLGPYRLRQDALAAEKRWLENNL